MWTLHYDGELTWDLLRDVWQEVLTALGAPLEPWEPGKHEVLPDDNHPARAGSWLWTAPGARWQEEAACGSGDPRDGYGYHCKGELTVDHETVRITAEVVGSAWTPWPCGFAVRLDGAPPHLDAAAEAFDRATGQQGLAGARAAIANIQAAREHHPAAALRWLAFILEHGNPEDFGWSRLLDLRSELLGEDEEGLARVLREAPEKIDAWERAAAAPPEGLSPAMIAAVHRRLRPWLDQGVATRPPWREHQPPPHAPWFRLDNGLGPRSGTPLLDRLRFGLFREIAQAPTATGPVQIDGVQLTVSERRARWVAADDPLPVVVASRLWRRFPARWATAGSGAGRLKYRPQEEGRWSWVWGRQPGDCLRMAWWVVRLKGREVVAGEVLQVVGTEVFRQRVRDAMVGIGSPRLVAADPTTLDSLFPERAPRPALRFAVGDDPVAAVLAALAAMDVDTRPIVAALVPCDCADRASGACAHGRELYRLERSLRAPLDSSQREVAESLAASSVLRVAIDHWQRRRAPRKELLRQAAEAVAQAAATRPSNAPWPF